MRYEYDIAVIGLGPAGMAVSIMASEMGLRVCAIEAQRVGGECMNVGCIPSKALLRIAGQRHALKQLDRYGFSPLSIPAPADPFSAIQADLRFISEKKTMGMFKKVDLLLQKGAASFVDPHTLRVGERTLTARRIFICTGTRPALPPLEGIERVSVLTNDNLFTLPAVPASLLVIGGGAIACEMAQAFSRLGTEVRMVIRGGRLLKGADADAVNLLEKAFAKEGIRIERNCEMQRIHEADGLVHLETGGGVFSAERVLCATGRSMDFSSLNLDGVGIKYSRKGIEVDRYLRTSLLHVFAAGDCNGHHLFSHSAMHQGMLALMNAMLPWPLKRDFREYVVPWTVFTDPQISQVGPGGDELKAAGVRFETVTASYGDYGAAIAEKIDSGFVKVLAGRTGRLFSATVVGEGSAEMINEWGLAIQSRARMTSLLFLQHSFPSMAFLNKRVSENWMMNRMKSGLLRALCRLMFRAMPV